MTPQPTDNPWEDHWRDHAASARLNPAQAFRRRLIRRLLGAGAKQPGATILDIGCGPGDLLLELSKHYPDAKLTGVDVSASGLEQAQAKLPNAQFLQTDLIETQPDADPSNFAVCSEVLEHVDNPVTLLRHSSSLIATEGTLVVTVPGGQCQLLTDTLGTAVTLHPGT
jgi:trans-aconitate methyltransferase